MGRACAAGRTAVRGWGVAGRAGSLALLIGMALPAAALAQPSLAEPPQARPESPHPEPERTIWMRSGEVVRGRAVMAVPEHYLLLQLPTGVFRRLEWSLIDKIGKAKGDSDQLSIPLLAREPVVIIDPNAVPAEIDGSPNILLSSRLAANDDDPFIPLCQLPCSRRLSHGQAYQVGGPGLVTEEFSLGRSSAPIQVKVRAGAKPWHSAGVALLVVGSAVALSGIILLVTYGSSSNKTFLYAGVPVGLLGLSLIGFGAVETAKNGTSVDITPRAKEHTAVLPLGRRLGLSGAGLVF